jgi:hypothetical protein
MPAEIAFINPRHRRKHKKTSAHRRRHVAKRAHSRRRPAVGYAVGARKIRRRKLNPRHRVRAYRARRHHRHNPRFSIGGITRSLIPAAIGGAGAVLVDIGVGYLGQVAPIPDFLRTGYGKVALQVAAAFGMGFLASKLVGREKGHAVTLGALTVAAYGLVRNVIKTAAPTVPGLSGDMSDNIGAYLPSGVGAMNPAAMLQGHNMGAYLDRSAAIGDYGDGM